MRALKFKHGPSGHITPTHPDARIGTRGPVTTYEITDVPDDVPVNRVQWLLERTALWDIVRVPYSALGEGKFLTAKRLADLQADR